MIGKAWLNMFAAEEMRVLISGTPSAFSTEDLKANTQYAGGYGEAHELIVWFWEVVDELTPQQKSDFLRFATSCSRAPLLGFQALSPRFCVQRSGDVSQDNWQTANL